MCGNTVFSSSCPCAQSNIFKSPGSRGSLSWRSSNMMQLSAFGPLCQRIQAYIISLLEPNHCFWQLFSAHVWFVREVYCIKMLLLCRRQSYSTHHHTEQWLIMLNNIFWRCQAFKGKKSTRSSETTSITPSISQPKRVPTAAKILHAWRGFSPVLGWLGLLHWAHWRFSDAAQCLSGLRQDLSSHPRMLAELPSVL